MNQAQDESLNSNRDLLLRIVIGTSILLGVLLARFLGLLEPLELLCFDLILKLRRSEPTDERILLIEIDSNDILAMGNSSKISTHELIDLINQIQENRPAVIGLNILTDLINESDASSTDLSNLIARQSNIIIAEKFLPPFIYPLPKVPSERIGFTDVLPDQDFRVRRAILGSYSFRGEDKFSFSFSLLLAKFYLEDQRYILENGKLDEDAMRFGHIEIPRIYPNTGGYNRVDHGGIQTLVNYRSGKSPFKKITLKEFKSSTFNRSNIKDKVIIIAVTDPELKFGLSASVSSQIDGLEMTAHFTSQVISAVLDNRPLIKSWNNFYEYIFILLLGIPIIFWTWKTEISLKNLLFISGLMTLLLFLASYFAFSAYGLWLVIAPSLVVAILNFLIYLPYSYHRKLLELKNQRYKLLKVENQKKLLEVENQKKLLEVENQKKLLEIESQRTEDRRKVIERTFDIIHNGPLQSISIILSKIRSDQESCFKMEHELETLSQEIRIIGNYLKQEGLTYEQTLYLKDGDKLDLRNELHELFYQVYRKTLERDFPIFKSLKVNLRSFDSISSESINFEVKRELCRFLEESICNVGKHSVKATSLKVEGKYSKGFYTLMIQDNGFAEIQINRKGKGTEQAQRLANKLSGQFHRSHIPEVGTLCSLHWKV